MNGIKNMIFSLFKNKKSSLVNKFTLIIAISIFISIIFTSFYNIYATYALFRYNQIDKTNLYNSISNIILERSKEDIKNNNYKSLSDLSNFLIKNNLVLYVSIADLQKNKYIWSSSRNMIGTRVDSISDMEFKQSFAPINTSKLREINTTFNNGKYQIIFGYSQKYALSELITLLMKGNIAFIIIFLILGSSSAFILAKLVIKPIERLADAAKEFSKGKLKTNVKISDNDEIGFLAHSFNDMAKKLDTLYTSLEDKVEQRTQQLSAKNKELEAAYKELKETQAMLVHNEKMASLGQLVAGVAHELNNPLNFVYGNLAHLRDYSEDLMEVIDKTSNFTDKLPPEVNEAIESQKDEVDYKYIKEDLPMLLNSCKDGTERCMQIVSDLKNFSRLDESKIKDVNLIEGIESTLNILKNKFKDEIKIIKNYEKIPKVNCYASQLNQVFMNIIDNAIQSIDGDGTVTIDVAKEGNNAVVSIADNGIGIDENIKNKIFDPFFTTKPVGQGTGLGLSICYKIIKMHNGVIFVESEKNKGTKFIIKIPFDMEKTDIVKNRSGKS